MKLSREVGIPPTWIVAKEARSDQRDYVSNGDHQPDYQDDARNNTYEGKAIHFNEYNAVSSRVRHIATEKLGVLGLRASTPSGPSGSRHAGSLKPSQGREAEQRQIEYGIRTSTTPSGPRKPANSPTRFEGACEA